MFRASNESLGFPTSFLIKNVFHGQRPVAVESSGDGFGCFQLLFGSFWGCWDALGSPRRCAWDVDGRPVMSSVCFDFKIFA